MRFALSAGLAASVLVGSAVAQSIDIDGVEAAPTPVVVTPPVTVASESASVAPVAEQTAAAAAAASAALESSGSTSGDGLNSRAIGRRSDARRSVSNIAARDGNCAPQPAGAGPVATPDTAAAFEANQNLWNLALNAPTPAGYSLVFNNLTASLSASNYMGLHTLNAYDPAQCQSLCDQAGQCVAFNLYAERDPTEDPNTAQCNNPPSTTNYKCTLWGAPVSAAQANNYGQWRDGFQVVIAASNAYNKAAPPASIPGFTGPTELGGAINAPLDKNGYNTYMGYSYYPFSQSQGYTPSTCAAACQTQTNYDYNHPNSDGTYMACNFFNAYVLSKNGVAQGLYCTNYNETWAPSYATNYGQHRGSDEYTVSESYAYALSPQISPQSVPKSN